MIRKIKQFINEHKTLIVVVILLLFVCVFYWYFCCKNTQSDKVKGSAAKIKVKEDGTHEKILDDGNKIEREYIGMQIDDKLQIPVLSQGGVIFIKNNLSVFSSLPIIYRFFSTDYNLYDIIKNPIQFITGNALYKKSTLEKLYINIAKDRYPDECFYKNTRELKKESSIKTVLNTFRNNIFQGLIDETFLFNFNNVINNSFLEEEEKETIKKYYDSLL